MQTVLLRCPSYVDVVYSNGRNTKYARFLKIGNVALYQERTILIISKFQYTQCISSRPVKLEPISRSISSEWYTIFVSYDFIVWNKPARLCTRKYMKQCSNNASECKYRWNAVFCLIHFSLSQRWHSLKWFSYFKWRIWGYYMSEIKDIWYEDISNAHLSRVWKRIQLSGSCLSTINGFGSTQFYVISTFLCHIGVPTFSWQNKVIKVCQIYLLTSNRTNRLSTEDR